MYLRAFVYSFVFPFILSLLAPGMMAYASEPDVVQSAAAQSAAAQHHENRHLMLAMRMLSDDADKKTGVKNNSYTNTSSNNPDSRIKQIALTGQYVKKGHHEQKQTQKRINSSNNKSSNKNSSHKLLKGKQTSGAGQNRLQKHKNNLKDKSRQFVAHAMKKFCLGGNYKALSKKAKKYDATINKYSAKYDVSHALIKAIITAESCFNAKAVSPKGAQGLMQLMSPTAKRFGVTDRFDTELNIKAGTRYLKFLLEYYEEDLLNAIAAYNAGEGAVDKYKGIPPYKETRSYVRKVAALYKLYSQGGGVLSADMVTGELAKTIFVPRALPKSRFSPYRGRARNIEHGNCSNRTGTRLRNSTRVESGNGVWQRIYVAQKGDNLMRVMQKTGVHKNKIMQMNGLRSRTHLKPGQELLVWECRK